MHFDKKRSVLICLSADNRIEAFIVNVDKPESILKKLTRQTKKSLKRTFSEANPDLEEEKQDKDYFE